MNKLSEQAPIPEQAEKIKALREQAKIYLDEQNHLVEQLWDIDEALLNTRDTEEKNKLLAKKAKINQLINEINQKTNYDDLIEEIRALETACYGHAITGGSSPSGML